MRTPPRPSYSPITSPPTQTHNDRSQSRIEMARNCATARSYSPERSFLEQLQDLGQLQQPLTIEGTEFADAQGRQSDPMEAMGFPNMATPAAEASQSAEQMQVPVDFQPSYMGPLSDLENFPLGAGSAQFTAPPQPMEALQSAERAHVQPEAAEQLRSPAPPAPLGPSAGFQERREARSPLPLNYRHVGRAEPSRGSHSASSRNRSHPYRSRASSLARYHRRYQGSFRLEAPHRGYRRSSTHIADVYQPIFINNVHGVQAHGQGPVDFVVEGGYCGRSEPVRSLGAALGCNQAGEERSQSVSWEGSSTSSRVSSRRH